MLTLSGESRRVGTFVKTDSPQIIEILGLCGLDFAVLDAEHAPFDRLTLDRMLFAGIAVRLPILVRIPDHRDATILSALDLGAAGIVVPHVDTEEHARNVVAAARFVGGRRGISLSARFGGYGTKPRAAAIRDADQCLVICQIESGEAVENLPRIAAVPGVGGLLIGRSDLALSLGLENPRHAQVMDAVHYIIAVARSRMLPVILVCGDEEEVHLFAAMGANAFVIGSDQSLLRDGASRLRKFLPSAGIRKEGQIA